MSLFLRTWRSLSCLKFARKRNWTENYTRKTKKMCTEVNAVRFACPVCSFLTRFHLTGGITTVIKFEVERLCCWWCERVLDARCADIKRHSLHLRGCKKGMGYRRPTRPRLLPLRLRSEKTVSSCFSPAWNSLFPPLGSRLSSLLWYNELLFPLKTTPLCLAQEILIGAKLW